MKIFIGCPTRGEINYRLVEGLLKLCDKYKEHQYEFCFNSKQPTDVNRNFIVDKFLETNCDVLMFIDDDMIVGQNLFDILNHKFDIIAPVTLISQEALKPNLFMFDRREPEYDKDLIPVDACGCGCVFIKRHMFEMIEKPYFRFVMNPDGQLVMSETYYFYSKFLSKKVIILVDKNISVGHFKKYDLRAISDMNVESYVKGKKEALNSNCSGHTS